MLREVEGQLFVASGMENQVASTTTEGQVLPKATKAHALTVESMVSNGMGEV